MVDIVFQKKCSDTFSIIVYIEDMVKFIVSRFCCKAEFECIECIIFVNISIKLNSNI